MIDREAVCANYTCRGYVWRQTLPSRTSARGEVVDKLHPAPAIARRFTLEHQGVPIVIVSPRLQALHDGQPQPGRRLAFLLWPDSSEAQAQTNLCMVLHRSQIVLPDLNRLLQIDAQLIAFSPDYQVALDVAAIKDARR